MRTLRIIGRTIINYIEIFRSIDRKEYFFSISSYSS